MITSSGQNLVFLLSTPRAGSTLLSILLHELPGVLCPPEPWLLLRLLALNGSGNPDVAYNDEAAAFATREFLGQRISPDAVRAFATCVYNEKLSAAGKSLFVDKTPRYFHILPEIEQLFPQARFIWLQRNPLDVAASYKSTWNLPPAELFRTPGRSETLDFVQGLDVYQQFFRAAAPHKLTLRYEDLVAQPAASLTSLGRFLGVQTTQLPSDGRLNPEVLLKFKGAAVGDSKVHATKAVHAVSVDRWRTSLDPSESRLVLDILGAAIFRDLGYGDTIAEAIRQGWNPPAETEARQRRLALSQTPPTRLAALAAEISRLEGIIREQTEAMNATGAECDRLAAETLAATKEAQRAVQDSQQHIDALNAQLDRTATENQKTIDALRSQLDQLAATSGKQADYISVLAKERDRLDALAERITRDAAHYVEVIAEQNNYIASLKAQLPPAQP